MAKQSRKTDNYITSHHNSFYIRTREYLTDKSNMKKVVVILAAITFSLTACHMGKQEAQDSLKRNDKYKSEKVEQGPAIAPEYIEKNGTKVEAIEEHLDTMAAEMHATDSTHQEESH